MNGVQFEMLIRCNGVPIGTLMLGENDPSVKPPEDISEATVIGNKILSDPGLRAKMIGILRQRGCPYESDEDFEFTADITECTGVA